jgi:hypothetical protein
MDEKDSKPPAKARPSAKRLKRGEGDIRARQRSFMKQRRAVLLPRDEPGREAEGDLPQSAPDGADHQQQIAQYRRRQRKSMDAPDAPAGEEQTGETD